jgi:hypothetical protein
VPTQSIKPIVAYLATPSGHEFSSLIIDLERENETIVTVKYGSKTIETKVKIYMMVTSEAQLRGRKFTEIRTSPLFHRNPRNKELHDIAKRILRTNQFVKSKL